MQLIRPNCRAHFTAEDFGFILETLGQNQREEQALAELLVDEEAQWQILQNPDLFKRVVSGSEQIKISPYLYFFLLVRHVFAARGISSDLLIEYVAELMAEFIRAERMRINLGETNHDLEYLVDMIDVMRDLDAATRFMVTVHIGNRLLFLTGVFPEYFEKRTLLQDLRAWAFMKRLGSAVFRKRLDRFGRGKSVWLLFLKI